MSEVATLERARTAQRRPNAIPAGQVWSRQVFVCLAAAVASSGAILLLLQSRLTFFGDDWSFVLYRRGLSAGVFLDPHNEHIAVAPVAIYKFLLATFGMASALPFQVTSTLTFLLSTVLLFIYLRRRVGDWPALLGASLILFFGATWINLLWSFQIAFFGSMAAGLGMLLALDRDDRVGDRIACALLVVSISFSSLGLPFIAGALVAVAVGPRSRLGRLYVPLVPLGLFGIWWLGWGHTAETSVSLDNLLNSPRFVLNAVSYAVAALVGLATPFDDPSNSKALLNAGRILLVVAAFLAGVRLWRLGRIPRTLWIVVAVGGAFWGLAALNANVLRPPTTDRYLYPSGIFILLIAAEVLRGVRPGGRILAVAGALAAAAVISNLVALHEGYKSFFKPTSETARADLAAVEIASRANPSFVLNGDVAPIWWLIPVDTPSYLSAVNRFGSPAYTESELASSPEPARADADRVLGSALGLELAPAGAASRDGVCRTVQASPSGETGVRLSPGEITLRARAATRAEVWLGRFSDQLPNDLGRLRPRSGVSLTIPADRSTRSWRLGLRGDGPVTVCGSGLA